jgi:hypothetical protein
MEPLYIVVNFKNHNKWKFHKYKTHESLALAAAEAKRLSDKEPENEFVVFEAKPIGKVKGGKMIAEENK